MFKRNVHRKKLSKFSNVLTSRIKNIKNTSKFKSSYAIHAHVALTNYKCGWMKKWCSDFWTFSCRRQTVHVTHRINSKKRQAPLHCIRTTLTTTWTSMSVERMKVQRERQASTDEWECTTTITPIRVFVSPRANGRVKCVQFYARFRNTIFYHSEFHLKPYKICWN